MEKHTRELPALVGTSLFASSVVVVACALQPLDVVKIRLQTSTGLYRGAAHCAFSIVTREGPAALYAGMSAALLRHASHAVAWVSTYSIFISALTDQRPSGAAQRLLSGRGSLANLMGFHLQLHWPPTLHEHSLLNAFCFGAVVGATAAAVSTPAEVAMVRMATDGLLPKAKRQRYRHALDAMRRVYRTEGLRSLWAGTPHTALRSVVNLAVSLPFYSRVRDSLIASGMPSDSASLQFYCNVGTGLVSAVVTMPIDFAKTRAQCSDKTKCRSESSVELLRRMTLPRAVRTVYSGLLPYTQKLLLQAALAAVCYEYLANLYRRLTSPPTPSGGGG